jgi:hypothetical protein
MSDSFSGSQLYASLLEIMDPPNHSMCYGAFN